MIKLHFREKAAEEGDALKKRFLRRHIMLGTVEYEDKCVTLRDFVIKRQIETDQDNLIIRTPV